MGRRRRRRRPVQVLQGYGAIRLWLRERGISVAEVTLYRWRKDRGIPIVKPEGERECYALVDKLERWIRERYS